MRIFLIFVGVSLAGTPIVMSLPEATPPAPAVVHAIGTLQSAFQGGDVSLEFDEPTPQELMFPVEGRGAIRAIRCDDAWASAWVAREPECALAAAGTVTVAPGDTAYLCVRVDPTHFDEGAVGVCRASTSDGPWVLTYTMSAP